jgi:hypothetical protein
MGLQRQRILRLAPFSRETNPTQHDHKARESRWQRLRGRPMRSWPSHRPTRPEGLLKSQDQNLMRVTALVRFSAALLHSRPQERCGTKRQGHHASLQAFACTSARVRSLASPIAQGPLLHGRSARGGGGGGEMVESVSLVSERGSQPTRRRESNAVVSPPSSHSAGLNCPGNPGHNPANHLRCSAGRCSHNSSMARGAQRRGSWLIGWRGPQRGCRQIKAWRASTMRAAEEGGGGGLGCAGKQTSSCSGPTSQIAIVSSPLAVAAFLCASLHWPQCVRVPRVHRLQPLFQRILSMGQ